MKTFKSEKGWCVDVTGEPVTTLCDGCTNFSINVDTEAECMNACAHYDTCFAAVIDTSKENAANKWICSVMADERQYRVSSCQGVGSGECKPYEKQKDFKCITRPQPSGMTWLWVVLGLGAAGGVGFGVYKMMNKSSSEGGENVETPLL